MSREVRHNYKRKLRDCSECGGPLVGARMHKQTCGPLCRQRRSRRKRRIRKNADMLRVSKRIFPKP